MILENIYFIFISFVFWYLLCICYLRYNNAIEDEKNKYRKLYSNEIWTKYL